MKHVIEQRDVNGLPKPSRSMGFDSSIYLFKIDSSSEVRQSISQNIKFNVKWRISFTTISPNFIYLNIFPFKT